MTQELSRDSVAAPRTSARPSSPGFPRPFRLYVVVLGLACAAFVPAGIRAAVAAPGDAILWMLLTCVATLVAIPVLPRWKIDAGLGAPVSVAAAVLLSPALVVLVTFLGATYEREIRLEAPLWLSGFNRAQIALSAGITSLVADALVGDGRPWQLLVATTVGVMVFDLCNTGFITLGLRLRLGVQVADAAKDVSSPVPRFFINFGFVMMLASLFVVLVDEVGPWAVALVALPMWLGYSALRSARESEDRAEELAIRVRELETLNALGGELLGARQDEQVAAIGRSALQQALDTEAVEVVLDGPTVLPVRIPIKGAEPGVIGVPFGIDNRSFAVVEAVAGLTGMALQRVELERELAANEKALSRLSAQILEEGTHERSRVALRIHDDVLPALAAAQIQSDNVRTALERDNAERADALAAATQRAVDDGINRLREALDALRSQILVPGGLRDGLTEALSELRLTTGVTTTLDAPDPLPPLPLAVEILVLETVRGCLANVARHASASTVGVAMKVEDSMLKVHVVDDGCGFDPTRVEAGHHGLDLMARRVELARGRFAVDSTFGSGTAVRLQVPV